MYAHLRICLSELPEDFQLFVETNEAWASAGLPEMREQEDDEANQPVHDDPGLG
jgi:hypothetical protein